VILLRAPGHPEAAWFDDQMPVGRRDVDGSGLEALPVAWMDDWHRGHSRQDLGNESWRLRRDMQHNADWRREIGWQIPGEFTQRLDATGRGPDHDKTANRHGSGVARARRRKLMLIAVGVRTRL
jgi:hypothetical protein